LRLPCTGGRCRQRGVRACMYRVTKRADSGTTCSRRVCKHLPRRFVSRLATIQPLMLSYRHEDQGDAPAGDPQGAGAGAMLAAATASGVRRRDTCGAHADAGLQQATERNRMVRVAALGPGAGDAGVSPADAATFPQGHRDSLPGSGEGVANRTRPEGRTIPRREGAGPRPAAATGGPRRPSAPMSALRGMVLARAQTRVLRALLPVRHRTQQGPPREGEGSAGRVRRSRHCRFWQTRENDHEKAPVAFSLAASTRLSSPDRNKGDAGN
jgi:hypothetical protein